MVGIYFYAHELKHTCEYKGREFQIKVPYNFQNPTGYSDDPYGVTIEVGDYCHPKTGNPISVKLSEALTKLYGDNIEDAIFDEIEGNKND